MISKLSKGFFIIEFLVYLTIFSLMSVFFLQFVFTSSLYMKNQCKELTHALHCFTALDMIAHDISNASQKKKRWYVTEPDQLVWHSKKEKKDIGYSKIKDNLIRMTGNYDATQKKWRSNVSNNVVQPIDSLTFDYLWDDQTLTVKNITCDLSIAAKNKKIHMKRTVTPQVRVVII